MAGKEAGRQKDDNDEALKDFFCGLQLGGLPLCRQWWLARSQLLQPKNEKAHSEE
jgi:hypothetical protein